MEICWDSLEGIYFTRNKTFKKNRAIYIEMDACLYCGEPYLTRRCKPSNYCGRACALSGENNHNYGKVFSFERRKQMSKNNKGKNNPFYGKKHLKKHINNIRGEGNPNWKGGISCEPYCQDWTKEFKAYIKERDGNKCLNPYCFGNIYRLNVHHVDYNKKNCDPSNLITTCHSCNSKANTNRGWHESWYKAILSKRYGYMYKEVRYEPCANFC